MRSRKHFGLLAAALAACTIATSTTAFAAKYDELRAWGLNYYGQLGIGTDGEGIWGKNNSIWPKSVEIGTVKVASAGRYASFAVTSDNQLYAWGLNYLWDISGDTYLLGLGTTQELYNTPQLVMNDVKTVAAGWNHSIAIGTNGTLYTWGGNAGGQLGTGDNADRNTPTPIM
ncbi:MAG: hypothetical protein FWD53_01040, partial [Phycisphaerales bacterium]|nr:hypothetical protein [Phycisphaerales bacterium]